MQLTSFSLYLRRDLDDIKIESKNETAYHVVCRFVIYYKINKFVFALNYGIFSVFHQMVNTNF